jgi:hypothetical protein
MQEGADEGAEAGEDEEGGAAGNGDALDNSGGEDANDEVTDNNDGETTKATLPTKATRAALPMISWTDSMATRAMKTKTVPTRMALPLPTRQMQSARTTVESTPETSTAVRLGVHFVV